MNRANQRRLASVYSTGDISSDLAKYNQLKVRSCLLLYKLHCHNAVDFQIAGTVTFLQAYFSYKVRINCQESASREIFSC